MSARCQQEVDPGDGPLVPCGRRARHTRLHRDTGQEYPVCAHHTDPDTPPEEVPAIVAAAVQQATERAAAEQYPDHEMLASHEGGMEGFILGAEWERARQYRTP